MNQDKPGLATNYRDKILNDLDSGKLVKDIAKELGVTHGAISIALGKDSDYALARQSGLDNRLDQYQEAIDTAPDGLTLSRAREGFRAQSWRCEREFPARWGKEAMAVNINALGAVQVQIVSFADQDDGPVIEHDQDALEG